MFFIVSKGLKKIISEGHPSREGAQEELLQLQREKEASAYWEIWESENEDSLKEALRPNLGQ